MFDEENGPKKFNTPEHNEIPQPANAENSHESPEIDEIQAMQGEEVKELVEGAAETTSCTDRMKLEYYTPENENVFKDLWAFTKAAGKEHPTQLNTGNIHSVPITCSNGEPEVKGQTYLRHAAVPLGIKGGSATLKELKKIAGFEDREDEEYYSPENVLHDLEAFTKAAGKEHPTQLTTANIRFSITCSNGEPNVSGLTYLRHAAVPLGIKGESATLKELKKIAGFEDREDEEYYSPENVLHDLEAFSEAAGKEHPTQLTTRIHSVPITCSNGEPKVTGEKYLRNAAVSLGMKGGAATLKKLKKIAGFEDREDKEYYTPENVLHDLETFTEAVGKKHPMQLSTSNIKLESITCSNGEPKVTGEKYLRNAAVSLGMKGGAATLKKLKKIAGFEVREKNKQEKTPTSTPKNKPKKINEAIGAITELPKEFQEHNRKATKRISKIQNDTKSKALDCMKKATFIKGEAFEQLVGVFLAYQYPEEKIIPQYCLIVDPEEGYYGLRADYKVGNDIYEIKWGGESATAKIDECTDEQEPHVIAKGFNYKLISCVLNEKTKETFTPFLEEVKVKLKNDDCVEIFSSLTEKIKELADLDDTETLKKYRNAFFSIYMNAIDENNDRKEYIEEMMLDIATTTNLDEFIEKNELKEKPGAFDANFEYNNILYQGTVLISKNTKKDADNLEEDLKEFSNTNKSTKHTETFDDNSAYNNKLNEVFYNTMQKNDDKQSTYFSQSFTTEIQTNNMLKRTFKREAKEWSQSHP